MRDVILSLGSNQGNRFNYLQQAVHAIEQRIGVVEKISSYYETEPWGFNDETPFINQVIKVKTGLRASKILDRALMIEKVLGRQRIKTTQKYSGRTLDIDILFIENEIINQETLIVPHPYLHLRKFVLAPLNEIAPYFTHPLLNISVQNIYQNCQDALTVKKLNGQDILSFVA